MPLRQRSKPGGIQLEQLPRRLFIARAPAAEHLGCQHGIRHENRATSPLFDIAALAVRESIGLSISLQLRLDAFLPNRESHQHCCRSKPERCGKPMRNPEESRRRCVIYGMACFLPQSMLQSACGFAIVLKRREFPDSATATQRDENQGATDHGTHNGSIGRSPQE